eukprot:CAMPEP_0180830898 /NCGR_PEP_ID=MMETSP1038_2-20121128/76053_1 /TAXON_ID=632150 /ORGANISM="Azadinium spinosum, Strain 3D9" /LENGTH=218 /DNA_ID=CAMNT_0022874065 /DNA_START=528 /DNA_END=1181 /DNA_ORIENTATION=+
MDFDFGDVGGNSSGGPQPPAAKRHAVGAAAKDAGILLIINLIAKLCLSSALQVRVLRSIVINVYRVPLLSPFIEKGMDATRKFGEMAKKLRDGGATSDQVHARTFAHLWNALITVLISGLTALVTSKPDVQKHLDKVQQYCRNMKDAGIVTLTASLKYVKISRAWDRDHKKLEISVDDSSPSFPIYQILHEFLIQQDGIAELPGMAPAGDLERKIQEW